MLKIALATLIVTASAAFADAPVIRNVNITRSGDLWNFDVTVQHDDTGWDDYADAWRILDEQGNVLGQRNLAHPHVDEQPFTRSLSGIAVPSGVKEIEIQVHDTKGGWTKGGKRIRLR
ncbi:hypothetical protein ACFSUD_15790 [Sulfitobacter aestuarii]|uniref:Uncharacterized protein n=1 Tax=Sulfitobacter aestuarii TaxID=2161676 RepID=A0ABW5U579_9RHOB